MTVKEYLSQAFLLDQRIHAKLEMLENFRNMATRTTSILKNNKELQTKNTDAMSNTIAQIIDIQEEINADINQLVKKKQEIMHIIKTACKLEYQTLLELRYICFYTWDEIADRMHCTTSNIFKMHSKALKSISFP